MATDNHDWNEILSFLGKEAQFLDERNWDAWLDLYLPEAEYWVPAWDDDGQLISDPQAEISLIYYANRGGLEDRVYRIKTGRSSATMPLRRTTHLYNLLSIEKTSGGLKVKTNWQVHSCKEYVTISYYGNAEYILKQTDDGLKIVKKKTVVNNDSATTMMDIYTI